MTDIREDIKHLLEDRTRFKDKEQRIGIEEEYSLVDSNYQTVTQEIRDDAVDNLDFAAEEFGSSIAEIQTEPYKVSKFDELVEQLQTRQKQLGKAAAEQGAQLIRYGTNPFLDLEDFRHTENEGRYKEFSQQLEDNRNKFVDRQIGDSKFDPRDIGCSGMITSTQLNISAENMGDAVEKSNILYSISPFAVASAGNARILEGKDTGYNDIRIPLWERAADTRTEQEFADNLEPRVGRIDSYYASIEDYLGRLDHSHDTLQNAIKSNWKDTKIKFYDGEDEGHDSGVVVEARPVSVQPTIEEDASIHAFYLGRTEYAQTHNEELMPIELVNRNREKAFKNGLNTELYDTDGNQRDADDIIWEELEKAEQGLEYLDIDTDYLKPMQSNVESGKTPSRRSAEELYELGPENPVEEVIDTVNYLDSKA